MAGGSILKAVNGASVVGGTMTIAANSMLDVEGSAVLAGVAVTGTNGESPSTIEIGVKTEGSSLTLLDGTSIIGGNMLVTTDSILDVESELGATLDGVAVRIDAPSTIEIGVNTDGGSVLTVLDGTSFTGGNMIIAADSMFDVESAAGATLHGVTVANAGTIQVEHGSVLGVLGTTISNGALNLAGLGTLDLEGGTTLDHVTVGGTSGPGGSVINVSGAVTIQDETAVNGGEMSIAKGATLDIENPVTGTGASFNGVDVVNSGTIQVDSAGPGETTINLLLDGGTDITGGTLLIHVGFPIGTIEGAVEIGMGGATFDDVQVINNNLLAIDQSVALTIADGTSIKGGNLTMAAASTLDVESSVGAVLDGAAVTGTSGEGTSTIDIGLHTDGGSSLTLIDGTSISGGDMTIAADSKLFVESSGGATLHGVTVTNEGTIQVDNEALSTTVTLVLDGGTTLVGGNLVIHDPLSADEGVVEIEAGGATFDGVTVTNNNELIIDSSATLTLTDDTIITGGTIDDAGTMLVVSASEIDNATIDGGGDIVVTDPLTLSGVTLDDVTLSGSFTNLDTLTIDETVTLNGATLSGGTIDDAGTLLVTAASEIDKATIDGGGDVTANETLTLSAVTLADVTLSGSFTNVGTLTVEDTVTLNGATLSGGSLNIFGVLDSTGTSTLSDITITNVGTLESTSGTLTISDPAGPTLTNAGTLEANGGELDITNEPVINTGTLQAIDDSILKLTTTAVTNTGGTVNVGGGSTLDLAGTEIDNGSLTNSGTTNSTGTSTLSDVTITNVGTLESTGGKLTISDPAGPTLTNAGTLEANGGELDITSEPVINTGTLQAIDDSILKLTSTTVTNTGGTVNVGLGSTLDLSATEIDNGTLTNSGMLSSTGTSTLSDVTITNTGTFNVASGTLTVDPAPFINTGTVDVESGAILVLSGETLTNTGGQVNAAVGSTLDLSATEIDNGTLTNAGTTNSTGTSTLSDVAISNTGTFNVASGTLTVDPSPFINTGTVDVES